MIRKVAATAKNVATSTNRVALTDGFGRFHNYLRISLTERCNLRCLYCMPEQGIDLTPKDNLLNNDELVRLVKLFAGLGVTKVRLTGGEPLIRKDIVDVCKEIRSHEGIKTLGITTNGITLPRLLPDLHDAGVTHFNISLDTLDTSKYIMITRRNGLNKVLDSIKMAEAYGYNPVKINCVIMRGVNDEDIPSFVDMVRERNVQVRFIEYMPFDDNKWERRKMMPFMEVMDIVEKAAGGKLRIAPDSETAKVFHIDGFVGSFGFINSMTDHFCGTCNRIRMTADGNLKVCLFGEDEVSLLQHMRNGLSDAELTDAIRAAVGAKHFSHGGKAVIEDIASSSNRPMIKIGG